MYYTIGEFSRMTALSIKSLRLYHDKGLLVPRHVDEFTNYRYYDDGNFEVARTISILKRYDFSPAEIKDILEQCNEEEDALSFLEKKLREVEDKIRRYASISRDIQQTIQFERKHLLRLKKKQSTPCSSPGAA